MNPSLLHAETNIQVLGRQTTLDPWIRCPQLPPLEPKVDFMAFFSLLWPFFCHYVLFLLGQLLLGSPAWPFTPHGRIPSCGKGWMSLAGRGSRWHTGCPRRHRHQRCGEEVAAGQGLSWGQGHQGTKMPPHTAGPGRCRVTPGQMDPRIGKSHPKFSQGVRCLSFPRGRGAELEAPGHKGCSDPRRAAPKSGPAMAGGDRAPQTWEERAACAGAICM